MDNFDILKEIEHLINRLQHSTVSYSQTEIFEVLKRGFNDVKYDFIVREYNQRLEATKIKQDQTTA